MSTNFTIWTNHMHSNVLITASRVERKIKQTLFQQTLCATRGWSMESLLCALMSVKFFFSNQTVITKTSRFSTLRKALSKLTPCCDSRLGSRKKLKLMEKRQFKNPVSLLLGILVSLEFSLSLTPTSELLTNGQMETTSWCHQTAT